MDQQERFARMLRLVLKLLNAKVSDDSSVDDLDFVLSCGNAILECRWSLYEKYLKTPLVSMQHARWNDILLLDLSLEQALKTLLESNGSLAVSDMDATLHLVQLALENSCLSAMPNGEILICARQFNSFAFDAGEWKGTDWALRLHATIQRLYELLGAESIWWCSALGTLSTRLGESLNASDPHVCSMLPEFVVRGTHFASLSQLLPNLGKMVRGLAGLGSWQVVCAGNATSRGVSGIVRVLDELKLVTDEDQIAQEPCILLASTVHGEADIPAQVVAVLTLSTLDILSHIAVRARNERKMLASCCDDAEFAGLQAHAGKRMQVTCRGEGDSVHFEVLAQSLSPKMTFLDMLLANDQRGVVMELGAPQSRGSRVARARASRAELGQFKRFEAAQASPSGLHGLMCFVLPLCF
ncbi:Alpha-glucan water dikinase 2 [Porphyridium purpureum]|uniref:Alpha-glucan water dikinase 2 n=1 Tax=Porphyridium purpureum TaxID=35688 RepID=A0A5J4YTZ9_PORPP|nr:Alpha-glucan water dikinase 2 [Porphyridium purpureum]|eukprot:POR3020..scf229_5